MLSRTRPVKAALVLALVGGTIAPASASAVPAPNDAPLPQHPRPIQVVQTTPDRGFEWADAGVGAVAGRASRKAPPEAGLSRARPL